MPRRRIPASPRRGSPRLPGTLEYPLTRGRGPPPEPWSRFPGPARGKEGGSPAQPPERAARPASAQRMAASIPAPKTAKAPTWAYRVPSKLCPTTPPRGTEMKVASEATTAAPTPRDVAEGLHRERVEIREQHPDADEDEDEVGHEEPERKEAVERNEADPPGGGGKGDGTGRDGREPAHPVAHDEAAVHDRGDPDDEGKDREPEDEEIAHRVPLLEHLGRGAQVRDEGREREAGRDGVADRDPRAEDLPDRPAEDPGGERPPAAPGGGSPAAGRRATRRRRPR